MVYNVLLNSSRGAWPNAMTLWAEAMSMAGAEIIPDLGRDEAKRFREDLLGIQSFFKGTMDVPLREALAGIPSELPSLVGLVMVLKNPDESRIRYFEEDLNHFKLTPAAHRYAWVYYAALNGLNPFDGKWKDQLWLNRFCDAYSMTHTPHPRMLNNTHAHEQYKSLIGKKLGKANTPANAAGYPLKMQPVVDPEALRLRVLADLARPRERAMAHELLKNRYKTLAKVYTSYEYQVEAKYRIKHERDDDTLLRFAKPTAKVKVFDTKAFIRDWLADTTVFSSRYKASKDRKVLLDLYAVMMGEFT